MGLLYLLPSKINESSHITVNAENTLKLKTYGLPWIFWGYLIASLSIIFFLSLAVWAPVLKLLKSEELIDQILAYVMFCFIPLLSLSLCGFFFTDKIIEKKGAQLTVIWKIFFLPIFIKKIELKNPISLEIDHFLDSPNMARRNGSSTSKAFQNKGYFELFALTSDNQKILIDRHSLKVELEKIQNLLKSY